MSNGVTNKNNKKAKPKKTKPVKKEAERGKRGPGGDNNPNLAKLGEPYRWKTGQSGNPSGRPKNHKSVAGLFRKQFDIPANDFKPARERAEAMGVDPKELTVGDVFALSIMADGLGGREGMSKEIINRLDGKNPDVILTGQLDETKIDLGAVTDDQLRKMLRKEVSPRSGNGNNTKKPKRKAARKKTTSG